MKKTLIPYFGRKNLNNRIYTKEECEKIVEMFNSTERPVFGQLGYPEESFDDVSLTKASHMISDLKIEGDELVGTISILETDEGTKLKKMINEGVFRPRCIGTINDKNEVIVDKIISFDFVPKETDAFKEI